MELINIYKVKPGTIDYVFIGRNPQHHKKKHKFTRQLPELANPFEVGVHGERGECVELFRKWLWRKIKYELSLGSGEAGIRAKEPKIINALLSLKDDDILGCFCVPHNRCHGEVIIGAYNYLKRINEVSGI